MKVKARILDSKHKLIVEEIIEVSDAPMFGRKDTEIEDIVSIYVNNWAMKHFQIQFDIIDNNSGQYPFIDWEKR